MQIKLLIQHNMVNFSKHNEKWYKEEKELIIVWMYRGSSIINVQKEVKACRSSQQ